MNNKLISSLRGRYSIICSTDVVGFLGNPIDAEVFWRAAVPNEYSVGLEMIAFYHQISRAKRLRNLAGFHARCDHVLHPRSPELIMIPVNICMADPNYLYDRYASQSEPVYINSHNLLMEAYKTAPIKDSSNAFFVCENDNVFGSLRSSQEIGNRLSGSVFDIVHYCIEVSGKVGWEKSIDHAIEKIYEIGQCIVHISWGWNKKDALPENISDTQLTSISRALSVTQSMPVIEFQWGNRYGSLGCNPTTDPEKVKNATWKVRRLIDAGIIAKV